jgi:hypothetical protein
MRFSEWMEEEDVEKWLDSLSEEEFLEAIEIKYEYTDTSKGIVGKWSFLSNKNNRYDVTSSKLSNDIYHVMFMYVDKNGNPTTTLTNFNDTPTAIFSSVYNVIENEIIKKYHPKEIRFEAHGYKRQKVYNTVLRRYINDRMKKYGYELQVEQHEDLPLKIYRYIKGEQYNG